MTRLDAEWLKRPETKAVTDMLEAAGHQVFFVGGCVRDGLLGRPVGDLDLSTDARPKRVVALAEAAGLKPVPTGIDHGTVTVVSQGMPHEVTTFRRDIETDGRRAVVAFADGIAEDAQRRDLTMNALYADPRGEISDPVGGLPDLAARRVRFIGNPETRIREDYLRILRFFRFHAWYADPGGGLDAEGLAASAALAEGLETLSRERVGAEIKKLLAAPDPGPALGAMGASGILARVLPGADAASVAVLAHLEDGQTPDPIRRLAALGGEDVAERLRLSRAEARRLTTLAEAAREGMGAAELGYRLRDLAEDALLVRAALVSSPLDPAELASARFGAAQTFPLRAADLMPRYSGPALGDRLAELEAQWIASDFRLDRDTLLG